MKNKLVFLLFLLFFTATLYAAPPKEIHVVGSKSYAPFIFLDANKEPKGIFVDL